MPTDTDLIETFAPLREVEPTPAQIARVLAAADDERRAGGRDPILGPVRRRPARVVALVAATAALIGALAALPGGDADRPQSAHGILETAAAVAAQQPGPAAYRYTRVLDRFVYAVNAPDGQRGRVAEQQSSENWTSDGWRGRTIAMPRGGSTPISATCRAGAPCSICG